MAKNDKPKFKIYEDSDYVEVALDGADEPLSDRVPKSWIGTDLLPDGVVEYKTGSASAAKEDEPVKIPDGDPSDGWTVKQLDAYAERENIDLSSAGTKKDERFAAIVEAKTAPAV